MTASRCILLFGGTFDPPHLAHVKLPMLVMQRLGCSRVIFIPAARNPLKEHGPWSSDADRLAMLSAAVREVPGAEVDAIEIDRGGASYFIDTVEAMRDRFGDQAQLYFLIGADQALAFHQWKDWRRILKLATPVVMLRPPWNLRSFLSAAIEEFGEFEAAYWLAWTQSDLPQIDISATQLRESLRSGNDPGDALPEGVRQYIRTHHLYQNGHVPPDRAAQPDSSSENAHRLN